MGADSFDGGRYSMFADRRIPEGIADVEGALAQGPSTYEARPPGLSKRHGERERQSAGTDEEQACWSRLQALIEGVRNSQPKIESGAVRTGGHERLTRSRGRWTSHAKSRPRSGSSGSAARVSDSLEILPLGLTFEVDRIRRDREGMVGELVVSVTNGHFPTPGPTTALSASGI